MSACCTPGSRIIRTRGEWFSFEGDDDARELLIEGFVAFSDDRPDSNSIDFIYWYNGEGMVEFQMAMHEQKLTLPKFQKQESANRKKIG